MKRQPRFEIVRVDGGWFVRFVAANGLIVWVTPGLHTRKRAAVRAVELVTAMRVYDVQGQTFVTHGLRTIEVRHVDERTGSAS